MENPKLQAALLHYPPEQRFFSGEGLRLLNYFCDNALVLGYGTYAGTTSPDFIPQNTKGFYSYYGSGIKNLLAEVLKTDIAANLECLVIGITIHHTNNYSDYSEISRLLSQVHFPKLKHFEYGIDEMVVNTASNHGNIGDVTGALQNMPNLEELYLYGNFRLSQPVHLPQLMKLETLQNDRQTNINGGKITNDTVQLLLTSKFSSLRLLSMNVSFNDDLYEYSLPEAFLNGESTPDLKVLQLYGQFKEGTKLQMSKSDFLRRRVGIDEAIDEPEG
jgi:hypothetical protein